MGDYADGGTGFYEDWKCSTPLQRIQMAPRLPEELKEHQFQRTEQRGIQMLLKAIPEAEQQALVTDRALSSTANFVPAADQIPAWWSR